MLKQIGLALLAVMTLGASVLWQQNKSLKREKRQLQDEKDKAEYEAKSAQVREQRANERLKEDELIRKQQQRKIDRIQQSDAPVLDELLPDDIKVGLDD